MKRLLVAGLVWLVACAPAEPTKEPTQASETPTAVPTKAEPEPAAKLDVTVVNLSSVPCNYVACTGSEAPASDAAVQSVAPRGQTKIQMATGEYLCLQGPDGKYGTRASVQQTGGEILFSSNCRSIAASEAGFTPKQRASLAAHTVDVCCGACEGRECTGCTEPKPGKACAKKEHAGRCAMVDDVLDCVPATNVDADGNVRGQIGPVRQ